MIARAIISPEDVVLISKTNPMVVLIETVKIGESRNILLRAPAYDTARHITVLPLQ